MKWAKTTRYQSTIQVEGKVYNILCTSDFDGEFATYANGEYITDFEELPTKEQLEEVIGEYNFLEQSIKNGIHQRSI